MRFFPVPRSLSSLEDKSKEKENSSQKLVMIYCDWDSKLLNGGASFGGSQVNLLIFVIKSLMDCCSIKAWILNFAASRRLNYDLES